MVPEISDRWSLLWAKFQIPVARQRGREMSAPRPYGTDPFHPLNSIHNQGQVPQLFFFHMVSSSVSWHGADLSIAHAFLGQGWGPLLKSCFVPYGTFQCVLAQNRWYLRTRTYWTNDFVTTSCCPIKVFLSFFACASFFCFYSFFLCLFVSKAKISLCKFQEVLLLYDI